MTLITKTKILKALSKFSDKALVGVGTVGTAISTMAVNASAATGGLSDALSGIDTDIILTDFYGVLPLVLTIVLPIVGAKVVLNFLFSAIKGA